MAERLSLKASGKLERQVFWLWISLSDLLPSFLGQWINWSPSPR
jgi:hypothetical protein